MGSSKQLSNREIFYLVLLFQQSGLFWLLPHFFVQENGTIGLLALLFGIIVAVSILWVVQFWSMRMPECGFVTALQQKNQIVGSIWGMLLFLFYLLFACLMLYSFIDVVQHQMLRDTPQVVLCVTAVLFVGWMSWSGLESIARLSVFGLVALCLIFLLSIVGSADLFVLEHALPLHLKNPAQFHEAALQSAFCYSGLLMLFMIYPASKHQRLAERQALQKQLFAAVWLGTLFLLVWTGYALCIFGEYSVQSILWIPVHLARMVQMSSFMEQTESLFIVGWMGIVLCNSSLFLWCASEGMHQLIKRQNNIWLHSGVTMLLFVGLLLLRNRITFLYAVQNLAQICVCFLPILLLGILYLAPRRR